MCLVGQANAPRRRLQPKRPAFRQHVRSNRVLQRLRRARPADGVQAQVIQLRPGAHFEHFPIELFRVDGQPAKRKRSFHEILLPLNGAARAQRGLKCLRRSRTARKVVRRFIQSNSRQPASVSRRWTSVTWISETDIPASSEDAAIMPAA